MTDMSDYLENELCDHVLGTSAYTPPAGTFAQLHTGASGEDGTANVATENTRQALTFAAAASLACATSADTEWLTVAATETYTHISIHDAATGGNCLYIGAFSSGIPVTAGDKFTIPAGSLTVTHGGAFTTYSAEATLNMVLRNVAFTMPASHFAKLHIGDPGVDAANNAAAETTRSDIGAISAAVGGSGDNDAVISWSSVSTTETYSHLSIHDAATAGNPLLQGPLTATKAVTAGDDAEIPAASLVLNFT